MSESATLRLTIRIRELERGGASLISFGAGEPHFPSPDSAVAEAQRALSAGSTRYTSVAGILDLRRALAERYRELGAPWEADQVLVTVGAKAALFELAVALFDGGDEVVIPQPCWVTLPEQVLLAGAEPILVPMSAKRGFEIDAEALIGALTPRTRAVIVNSPCNPTGGVITADGLRRLVEVCSERQLLVIADETYEAFVYDGREHASVAQLASEFPQTVILVSSFSKSYAMTGWRVGYMLGPAEVIAAAMAVQGHATSNVTSFAMFGALAALDERDEVARRVREYQESRDAMLDGLNSLPGVRCAKPAGAFYAFPNVEALFDDRITGSLELSEWLLETAGVAVVPGSAFGDDRHLRCSFACSRATIEEGVSRIERALARR